EHRRAAQPQPQADIQVRRKLCQLCHQSCAINANTLPLNAVNRSATKSKLSHSASSTAKNFGTKPILGSLACSAPCIRFVIKATHRHAASAGAASHSASCNASTSEAAKST